MAILDLIENPEQMPQGYKALSQTQMAERVWQIKESFGNKLFLPAHHYQKDEVIQFADAIGDSLQLAQIAAKNTQADYIVFCGVHFMAETADMLTQPHQRVILPDMRAGCTMADMANLIQLERAWDKLESQLGQTILPLTYVNSTAEIKAFVGRHGGATVTSSNAKRILSWALEQKQHVLFLPDQHLGRNTAFDLGIALEQMAIFSPAQNQLLGEQDISQLRIILWQGHCSVHEKFTLENIQNIRQSHPETNIIVHPECSHEVVVAADFAGSTKYIIDVINDAQPNTQWAIGTEMNLVNRLIAQHPDKQICSLNPNLCPCLTMNRIDLPHLLFALESLVNRAPIGVIQVDEQTTTDALTALERMLNI
ncbi:quinolinate synthase NadA [Celerinatantimonas diazotrophica]|uniref:Quinolinate synthase n=1 Tax=Celerinatantimonas diazotrophica TaxID=412034 RepID=A0A4R1J898_9GAMM|nr:quinolinate synthase NadA [Celerinatantimonas diazotrophica]TCK46736.1 quinolinate synthetase [Celerinatantimonas diazotrophica]CAG9295438.1 Quinolinate synthase A [Celerinatantimonas diazotrophica]